MSTTFVMTHSNDPMVIKWRSMLVLSIALHVAAALVILIVPDSIPSRRVNHGIVYEVDLVEMPPVTASKLKGRPVAKAEKNGTIITKKTQAKRIQVRQKEQKPLVVSKRTTEKEITTIKKPDLPSVTPIDKPVQRKEKEIEAEERSHIRDAISKLREEVGRRSQSVRAGNQASSGGISMRIYQMEVETKIRSNWAYPVALQSEKNLEAVVLVKVKKDGTILTYELAKRSNNTIFDQSVIKAIEKSGSMPPFPEDFRENDEEIEITFNLKDLENN